MKIDNNKKGGRASTSCSRGRRVRLLWSPLIPSPTSPSSPPSPPSPSSPPLSTSQTSPTSTSSLVDHHCIDHWMDQPNSTNIITKVCRTTIVLTKVCAITKTTNLITRSIQGLIEELWDLLQGLLASARSIPLDILTASTIFDSIILITDCFHPHSCQHHHHDHDLLQWICRRCGGKLLWWESFSCT